MSIPAKKLYQTNLNWHGDTYEFYTWAFTKAQARMFSFKQLAKRLKVSLGFVSVYFNGEKDNIHIKEVAPWKP